MKKFFAIVFAICFIMSGCNKDSAIESSVNAGTAESSISEVNNEESQPATNQDEEIIAHCLKSAEISGANVEVRIEDETLYYLFMSDIDCTESFIYMISTGDYSTWENIKTEGNGLCESVMNTVELYGADYDVVVGIMGKVYDEDTVLLISQNGVIIYDFLEEVLEG